MRIPLATLSFLVICIWSTETAEWCKNVSGHECDCIPGDSPSHNAIMCGYVSTPAQLEEAVKRILRAKPENVTTPFNFIFNGRHKLPYLPQDLFQGVRVRYIQMMDVELERLEDRRETESPLNVLSHVLENIFLVRVRYLDNWDWSKVRLESVETIRIQACPFTVLTQSFSDAFPNLEGLSVLHCDVLLIEPQALAFPNKKIEYISFVNTKLALLSSESFRRKEWTGDDRLDNLEGLYFRENEIGWISDDFLVGMEKLKRLEFISNRITSLSKDFFLPCDKAEWSCALERIRLEENPFDSDTCQLIHDLHKKHTKAVEIPLSLHCVCLLELPGSKEICETD